VTRPDLPTGTVTFLFTDVEGSTRLLQEHGAAYADLLAAHRAALRGAFAAHGGVEVDTQGDAFFVAFGRAGDAVAAAAAGRDALEQGPVRVRMGIHTGEPLVTTEGYVGLDVHRAARIAAAAHGGQIVVSEATGQLCDGDVLLRDLGKHRLKDLTGAQHLYQLGAGEFPPLRTLDATNLPVAASPLVGRERELDELVELLSNGTRLLTLTGPGGTGKTRLALQAGAELVGRLRDGVFWVPLAGLADPELIASEIAQAIGARDDFEAFIRDKQLLILLDNFEHLLAAAPAVSATLALSPGLRVLVTSRAPLHVSGEREYRVEPLPTGDAATLFAERARSVGRELSPDPTVEAICKRLDGLPLAVELAAARTKLLAPDRLLERLDAALPLLTGGARDVPERQRTLRATIQWSYELLDPESRELFASLSVFAGSFPVEAAEVICGADIDGLAALVDSSLLKPIGDDRLLMLETIREYGSERLAASERSGEIRRKHAAYFAALAEEAYAGRFGDEAGWSQRLELDHDDLRAAFGALDADGALTLVGALGWFWLSHGHLVEGHDRVASALGASKSTGPALARAHVAAGALVARLGDPEEGRGLVEQAIARWTRLQDTREAASALDTLGWLLVYDAGHDAASLEAFERSLALHRDVGDRAGETRAMVGVCQVLVALGDVERAEALSRELLELAGDEPRTKHFAYHFLADCALIRGDVVDAGTRYRESLRAALPLGDLLETSFEVQGVAMAAAGAGDARLGVLLAASVEALWESLGTSPSVRFWDELLTRYLGQARAALGGEAHGVHAEGRALPFDDAVELALSS
jgi:predicted ATPase/class 3 adenylate cyclase